jgi:hypothetical protein
LELELVINEIWERLNADTNLSDMVSDIAVGDSGLKVVSDALSTEISDRQSAIKFISDALSTEISDRQSDIKYVSDSLLTVSDALSTEISDRASAIKFISDALSTEVSDRASAIKFLSDQILTVSDALSTEVSDRASAISFISDALSDTESEQKVISDALSDVVSDLVVVSDSLSDTESEQKVISDALSDLVYTGNIGGSDTQVQYNNGGVHGGDSTFTFNDSTKLVSAQDLALTGYIDIAEISEPATPAADTLRLYTEDIQGFSFVKYLDSGGMKREVLRDSMILVYNNTGSTILANRVVYASGSFNNFPTVALAKSNAAATMPAIGVTIESIADTSYGRVMQVGLLENIDTSALSVGDILYVHDTVAGLVRITAPTTPALTQEIGTVLVDNASTGAIQIIARGLTGDEYGTAQNSFLIGGGTAGSKTLTFNAATDGSIIWDETKFDFGANNIAAAGLTVTDAVTISSNSVVCQPAVDAAAFFDIKNQAGSSLLTINSSTGNMGYGTGVASDKITVGGTIHTTGYSITSATHPSSSVLFLSAAGTKTFDADADFTYVAATNTLTIPDAGYITSASDTDSVQIDATGNVILTQNLGIGVSPPTERVHIKETADDAQFLLETTDAGKGAIVYFNQPDNSWSFGVASDGKYRVRDQTAGVQVMQIEPGAPVNSMQIKSTGYVGFSESNPRAFMEISATNPYFNLHNTTHEDTDGGQECIIDFYGEHSTPPGNEDLTIRFRGDHDGTGTDNASKLRIYTNTTGGTLTEAMRLDSSQLATFAVGTMFNNSVDSAAVANEVTLGGYEIAAGQRALAISQEYDAIVEVDETKFSHKLPVRINGATYYIMLTAT